MNFKKLFLPAILCSLFFATSCDSNDDEYNEVVLTLNATEIHYDENGVWADAMNPDAKVVSQGFTFSHTADVQYFYWTGMVASRCTDNADYNSTNEWLSHQCAAMPAGGMAGKGTPYIIGYWNSMETSETPFADRSCAITFNNDATFTPISMYVTNNSYAYYSVVDGGAYCRKFAKGDYFALKVYGWTGSAVVGPVTVYLADYRSEKESEWFALKDWTFVNLDTLGEVKGLFFEMESTDSGQWGINTPTYFALDNLKIRR